MKEESTPYTRCEPAQTIPFFFIIASIYQISTTRTVFCLHEDTYEFVT